MFYPMCHKGHFYVLIFLTHKLGGFLELMFHYKIAPRWFSIFHICPEFCNVWYLVKPCTWRKNCVSFSGLPTLHTKGFKNVWVLHIGLICKVKDIAIFSIPSSLVPLVDHFSFNFWVWSL
jgi:hypothetical protein